MNDYVVQLYLRDLSRNSRCRSAESVPGPDESTREGRVLANLRRVVRIAFNYRDRGLPLSDLINEGNIGLMRAAELFDPLRGVRFTHYAKPWIRVHMQRALNYQAWPVSLPADFHWRCCPSTRLRRKPAVAARAEAADPGQTEPRLHAAQPRSTPVFVPLESPAPVDEPGLALAEVLPDESLTLPDQEAVLGSDRRFVRGLVSRLAVREQRIIRLRFGLDDGHQRTLEEVGQLLGYVRQGIHRIEANALTQLRSLAAYAEPAFAASRTMLSTRRPYST